MAVRLTVTVELAIPDESALSRTADIALGAIYHALWTSSLAPAGVAAVTVRADPGPEPAPRAIDSP